MVDINDEIVLQGNCSVNEVEFVWEQRGLPTAME